MQKLRAQNSQVVVCQVSGVNREEARKLMALDAQWLEGRFRRIERKQKHIALILCVSS
jgi:hypothetical protein